MTEYTEVEHEGRIVRQYPDGALREPNGHFVVQHPLAAETIDHARSLELNQRRWEQERENQRQERDETQRALARSLVTQIAGAKTPADGMGAMGDILVTEMTGAGAAKEHGVSNYVRVMEKYGQLAGLIKEKVTDNRQVNIENLNLSPDASEHATMLLARLQERLVSRENDDELP